MGSWETQRKLPTFTRNLTKIQQSHFWMKSRYAHILIMNIEIWKQLAKDSADKVDEILLQLIKAKALKPDFKY